MFKPVELYRSDPEGRPAPHTFRPPKENRLVIALMHRLAPLGARLHLKVTDVDIADDDLDTLRALKGRRCLLTPSHSGGFEPYVLTDVCCRVGEHCNYLAAMELFERSPILAWLLQRLGVYSIIRGTADRPSLKTTKELLVAANRWLVVFPEGHTVWQNDMVMPFQQGLIHIAFRAAEEASRGEGDPSLLCVPIAVKFTFTQDMTSEIDDSLAQLEERLFPAAELPLLPVYERLRRVGEAVLAANEKVHGVEPEADAGFDERIQRMKSLVICELERRFGLVPRPEQGLIDRVRALFNAVDRIVYDETAESEYERDLLAERQREAAALYDELWRLNRTVGIYDGYVHETMTVERFLDVLGLLEIEVFKKRHIWGPRTARIKVGAPLDLTDSMDAYRADRLTTVAETTLALERSVRAMLEELGADCRAVAR